MIVLPLRSLPTDWEPTRATLHAYANVMGAVARTHATPHPKWWHISLEVRPTGLVTDPMPIPGGGTVWQRMDLNNHAVFIEASDGTIRSVPTDAGLTGSQFGAAVVDIMGELGFGGVYPTEKYSSDETRLYRASDAEAFHAALVNIDHNLRAHRAGLGDQAGPVQLWPHGFDIAFEWFGTKLVPGEEGEETSAQLNLGFYPAGRAYFYSNPWPFEPGLTGYDLPAPAAWHTNGWEGSILYYDELMRTPDPAQKLMEYAGAVFTAASPTLTA